MVLLTSRSAGSATARPVGVYKYCGGAVEARLLHPYLFERKIV